MELRDYKGTWAIWLFAVLSAGLIIFMASYKNPNKFMRKPAYDWTYGHEEIGEMNIIFSMVIRQRFPLFPTEEQLNSNKPFKIASVIYYYFDRHVEFKDPTLPLLGIGTAQLKKSDFANGLQNSWLNKTDNTSAYTNTKNFFPYSIVAFAVLTEWTITQQTKDGQDFYHVQEYTQFEPVRDYTVKKKRKDITDKWEIKFEESSVAKLTIDDYTHEASLGLPKNHLSRLKAIGGDQFLQKYFNFKFKEGFRGASNCIMLWSNNVFNAIISRPAVSLEMSTLENAVNKDNNGIVRGSFINLNVEKWHRRYIVKLSLFCTLLSLIAIIGIRQFQYNGWYSFIKPLANLIIFAGYLDGKWESFKAKQAVKAQARLEKEKLQAELEGQKEKLRQLKQLAKDEKQKTAVEEERQKQVQAEADLKHKLIFLQSLEINHFEKKPYLDQELRQEIQSAYLTVCQIPSDTEFVIDMQAKDKIIKLQSLLAKAEDLRLNYEKQKQQILDKLGLIKRNSTLVLPRLDNEERKVVEETEKNMSNGSLRPRILRQHEYDLNKILGKFDKLA